MICELTPQMLEDCAFREDFSLLMHQLSSSASADCSTQLKAASEDRSTHVFVAMDGSRAVGCATLCIANTPEKRLGFVEAVVVREEYRGRHIGRSLMDAVLAKAGTFAPISLHLTSRPSRTAANALYRSIGFTQHETNCYSLDL